MINIVDPTRGKKKQLTLKDIKPHECFEFNGDEIGLPYLRLENGYGLLRFHDTRYIETVDMMRRYDEEVTKLHIEIHIKSRFT